MLLQIIFAASAIHLSVAQLSQDHYTTTNLKQRIQQNGNGDYEYAYQNTNGITKNETGYVKNPGAPMDQQINAKDGCYSFTSPEGAFVSVIYVADDRGYNPRTRITYPGEPKHEQHLASPGGPLGASASLTSLPLIQQASKPVNQGYGPHQWDTSTVSNGWNNNYIASSTRRPTPAPTQAPTYAPTYGPPQVANGWHSHSKDSIWELPKEPRPTARPTAPPTAPPTVRPTARPTARPTPRPPAPTTRQPIRPTEFTTSFPPTTNRPLPKRIQGPFNVPINNTPFVPNRNINANSCSCSQTSPDSFSFRLADGSHVVVTYNNQGLSYQPSVKVYPNGLENYYSCKISTLGTDVERVSSPVNQNFNVHQGPPGGY